MGSIKRKRTNNKNEKYRTGRGGNQVRNNRGREEDEEETKWCLNIYFCVEDAGRDIPARYVVYVLKAGTDCVR